MKRFCAVLILLFLFDGVTHAQESFTAFGSTVTYTRPDSNKWNLVSNGMQGKSKAYLVMFEHQPIKDSLNRDVKPVIALICESVPESLDVIRYSIWKRGQTPFKVNKMMAHQDGSFTYKNSVGYEGEYKKDSVIHKIFIGHLRHGKVGIQLICDSTDGVFDKVEADMRSFLRSINFKE